MPVSRPGRNFSRTSAAATAGSARREAVDCAQEARGKPLLDAPQFMILDRRAHASLSQPAAAIKPSAQARASAARRLTNVPPWSSLLT